MTIKPDGIPQDVWAAADAALDVMLCNCIEASGTSEQLRIDSTEPIARAILAEREAQKERDARICDAVAYEYAQWQGDGLKADAAEECAASIRKGSRQLTPGKP